MNDFKIGARGMHGPCEKRTRGSDSDLSLELVTPVGWPAARAVPWLLSAGRVTPCAPVSGRGRVRALPNLQASIPPFASDDL